MYLRQKLSLNISLGGARYAFVKGDLTRALRALEKAEQIKPLSPAYRVFKSMLLTRMKQHEKADSLLASVVTVFGDAEDAEALYAVTYAQLLQSLTSQNFELAEVLFDRAKGIKVKASLRRALPLLMRPTVEWARSGPGLPAPKR